MRLLFDREWREIREMHEAIVGAALPDDGTGLLVMLRAYFDESGDHPKARETVVVGLLASPTQWKWLAKAWRRTLRRAGVRGEYKAAKCLRGEAPFDHLGPTERDQLRVSLGRIIDRYVPYAAVVGCIRDDFESEVLTHIDRRPRHPLNDMWTWCGRSCLEYIVKTPKRRDTPVACVFDRGHASEAMLFAHMHEVCRAHGWSKVLPTLTSAPSDQVPGLQAADWLVSEVRHDMDHQVFGARKRHNGFAGMFDRMAIDGGILSRDNIRALMAPVFAGTQRLNFEAWAATCADEEAGATRKPDAEEEAP